MNYIIFALVVFLVGVVCFWLGYWHGRPGAQLMGSAQEVDKDRNKNKIIEYVKKHGRIGNAEARDLCSVSESTAEEYLDELEKGVRLKQNGTTGPNVFYTLS